MATIYTLDNIRIRLNSKFSLQVPQLEIKKGIITSITGANGAGKSTLLRILALLLKPHRGNLFFSGRKLSDHNDLQRLRRLVTLVDQSPYLLQGSIYRNLAFGLKVRQIARSEQADRIHQALTDVGLTLPARRSVRNLSGGEKQRVALARALVLQPEVLLLDEPTANIDHASQPRFEELLQQLAAKGMTILLSTHVPEQARRLGDESIFVEDGQVRSGAFDSGEHDPGYYMWPDPVQPC